MRPILVTATRAEKATPYAHALATSGIAPEAIRVIVPGGGTEGLAELAAGAAGLLLSGGPDVAPERYGEAPRFDSVRVNADRDAMEWALLAGAEAARVPVLAVCRGMQLASVYLGGSLYQHLPAELSGLGDHDVAEPPDHPAHGLEARRPDLPLGALLGAGSAPVNSRHHQAVKRLGGGLLPVAAAPDGVLEAMQLPPGGWWLWGVQWHPEDLLAIPAQRELWRAFAQAARARWAPASASEVEAPLAAPR